MVLEIGKAELERLWNAGHHVVQTAVTLHRRHMPSTIFRAIQDYRQYASDLATVNERYGSQNLRLSIEQIANSLRTIAEGLEYGNITQTKADNDIKNFFHDLDGLFNNIQPLNGPWTPRFSLEQDFAQCLQPTRGL